MSSTNNALLVLVRVLLSFIFILSGFGKLTDPAGTAGMISGAACLLPTCLPMLPAFMSWSPASSSSSASRPS